MTGWIENYLRREEAKRMGGNFLYWKDGERRVVRFFFELTSDTLLCAGQHYFNRSFYYCPAAEAILLENRPWEEAGCPICFAMGAGPMGRAYTPVVNMSDGNKVAIMQQAFQNFWGPLMQVQAAFLERGIKMTDYNWTISRSGSDANTTYGFFYDPNPSAFPANYQLPQGVQIQSVNDLLAWARSVVGEKTLTRQELERVVSEGRSVYIAAAPQQMAPPQLQQVTPAPQPVAPQQPMMPPQPMPVQQTLTNQPVPAPNPVVSEAPPPLPQQAPLPQQEAVPPQPGEAPKPADAQGESLIVW